MGMFHDMMTKIFHHAANAEAPVGVLSAHIHPAGGGGTAVATAPAPAATAAGPVDVAGTLDKMAAANHEKLDWKHSIVDLMKLVGMDSSLSARKELAADLHYSGDTNDSASMNMWLHKEVMKKLAENGGKVPADLLAH
jgi:hypothetical protein